MGYDRFGRAVAIGAADATPSVLAMHEPAFGVDRIAVHEVRAVDGDRHPPVAGMPLEQAAVRHVRPVEAARGLMPDRALAVQRPLIEADERRVRGQRLGEPGIVDLHARDVSTRRAVLTGATGVPAAARRRRSWAFCPHA